MNIYNMINGISNTSLDFSCHNFDNPYDDIIENRNRSIEEAQLTKSRTVYDDSHKNIKNISNLCTQFGLDCKPKDLATKSLGKDFGLFGKLFNKNKESNPSDNKTSDSRTCEEILAHATSNFDKANKMINDRNNKFKKTSESIDNKINKQLNKFGISNPSNSSNSSNYDWNKPSSWMNNINNTFQSKPQSNGYTPQTQPSSWINTFNQSATNQRNFSSHTPTDEECDRWMEWLKELHKKREAERKKFWEDLKNNPDKYKDLKDEDMSDVPAPPIPIGTPDELLSLNGFGHYVLSNDIDCNGRTVECLADSFNGIIDGNGHTISNLTLSGNTESRWISLFNNLVNSIVTNVKFDNLVFDYDGNMIASALANSGIDSQIYNVTINLKAPSTDIPFISDVKDCVQENIKYDVISYRDNEYIDHMMDKLLRI